MVLNSRFLEELELAKEVKLVRNSIEIPCTDITSSATMIKCKLKIPEESKAYPEGKWTVVVINSDKEKMNLKMLYREGYRPLAS